MWLHIASDSKASAYHVYARIVERIFDLDDFPQLGLQQPEIAADKVADHNEPPYPLSRQPDRIVIVRVVHGTRDLIVLLQTARPYAVSGGAARTQTLLSCTGAPP